MFTIKTYYLNGPIAGSFLKACILVGMEAMNGGSKLKSTKPVCDGHGLALNET